MKYALMALAVLLAAAGCSKYEVYERNLQYMNTETYQTEQGIVAKRLEEAQSDLTKAQASGNPEEIKKALAAFNDAKAKFKSVDDENRRRNRGW